MTVEEMLNEVSLSGVAYEALRYVEVQIDRDTWEAILAWRRERDARQAVIEGPHHSGPR